MSNREHQSYLILIAIAAILALLFAIQYYCRSGTPVLPELDSEPCKQAGR